MGPTVSIVMPLYNKAPYVAEAIESVICQSFLDWELLIVDDGSTDGSTNIVQRYAKQIPNKIQLIQHASKHREGVNASRQLAVNDSKGSAIAFLDADDVWFPERLSHDTAILAEHLNAEAVVSKSMYFWPDESEPTRLDRPSPLYNRVIDPPILFEDVFIHSNSEPASPCSVTIRRSAVAAMEPWDPALPVAGDLKYFAELYFKFPVYVSDRCMAKYRQVPDGICGTSARDGSWREPLTRVRAWLEVLMGSSRP